MGVVPSTIGYPYFYAGARANFANGATADNLTNHFNRKAVNLANLKDPANNDFSPSDFSSPALGTLGSTPYTYNHWRWNPGPAAENVSLTKAVNFGPDNRYALSIRGEFYDIFNRHYFGAPVMNQGSPYFGQVTSVSGARTGQLGARFQW